MPSKLRSKWCRTPWLAVPLTPNSCAQANTEAARYKLAGLLYQNGVASQLDLLDAQRALFAARQTAVLSRLAQLQIQLTLCRAGWRLDRPRQPGC